MTTRLGARDLALVAVLAGIMAALGVAPALYVFGMSVPITLQSMGVMLAGGILGARRAFLSMIVFCVLVAVGLPLLAGGRGGLGVFASPTVGFLVGFPMAAWVVGLLTERFGPGYALPRGLLANVLGGVAVLHLLGMGGMMLVGRLGPLEAAAGTAVFLPGDLAKAVVAALVVRGVHAGYPGLLLAVTQSTPRERRATPV